jgi:hypothetical protein
MDRLEWLMPRIRTGWRPPVLVAVAAAALAVGAAPAYAADTAPPTAPGPLTATAVTTTSVTLTWAPSTDDVGVVRYDVSYLVANSDVIRRTETTTNSVTLAGGQSQTLRVTVAALDEAGNRSVSTSGRFTLAPGDTTPPTAPGTPVASDLSPAGVTLTWARSTDNVQGQQGIEVYEVLRVVGSTVTVAATVPQAPVFPNSTTLRTLVPGVTYEFAVRARDYAGNTSAPSGPVVVTVPTSEPPPTSSPAPIPPPRCTATYTIVSQWAGGFHGEVAVRNVTSAPITSWSVSWQYADGQTLTTWWAAIRVPDETRVSFRNEGWNGLLIPGQVTRFGFLGTWRGTNSVPVPGCA